MSQLSEAPGNPTQLYGALRDGLEALDLQQQVTFQAYARVILPIDGYVFWSPTVPIVVKGSLHYSQEIQQNEDETVGFATVTFTSECQVTIFTDSPTNTIYVATVGNFRYAFSQQQGLYSQASLWHYFGHSVYPAMASQLLDSPGQIDTTRAITSNSLSLWLALSNYSTPYGDWFKNTLTLYPADLVQQNLKPPYGVVDIRETRTLQSAPFLDINRNHMQLCADRCRVTLYGLQNNEAMDFMDCVMQYSANSNDFGVMNMPVIVDEKRTQAELMTIAMKKTFDIEISYDQLRTAQVGRQLILNALPINYIIGS